jgi:acyl carrier protein
MRVKLRGFIEKNFYIPEGETLSDEDSLLDRGVIDSTGVLELIGYLQHEFKIEVADEEMIPENLDSIARIEAYVKRKLAAAA